MHAVVSSDIKIYEPTEAVVKKYENMLVFANPEYSKKEQMGLWTGNTPRTISLMSISDKWISIPFGLLSDVFASKDRYADIANSTICTGDKINYKSLINPYDYQEAAIAAAIRGRNGIIIAPCGSGKTQIGLEIIARLGLKALWLTHTKDLLKQSRGRAESVFKIGSESYGTISDGKINIGKSITFATVQTMSKIDLDSVKNEWAVIVVDECHHVVGTPTRLQMFYKVVSKLCARYKFGLTATPKRADGLTACMYALLGGRLYEVRKSQLRASLCEVRCFIKDIDYTPDFGVILASDGTLQYTSLLKDLTENEQRNEQLIKDIISNAKEGERSLILSDRVQHVQLLTDMLVKQNKKALAVHGKSLKAVRNDAIQLLKDGEIEMLVATFALAKEGLDIPNLDNVFFATPQKNDTVVIQSAGRVARRAEGKNWGNVYDYADSFAMFRKWTAKRKKLYEKNEYYVYNKRSIN